MYRDETTVKDKTPVTSYSRRKEFLDGVRGLGSGSHDCGLDLCVTGTGP